MSGDAAPSFAVVTRSPLSSLQYYTDNRVKRPSDAVELTVDVCIKSAVNDDTAKAAETIHERYSRCCHQ